MCTTSAATGLPSSAAPATSITGSGRRPHSHERHRKELDRLPIWLFSSGPLGSQQIDEDSTYVVQAARPREFDELQPMLHPRGAEVFFGAWDR